MFTVLCWATFIAVLGQMPPKSGYRLNTLNKDMEE